MENSGDAVSLQGSALQPNWVFYSVAGEKYPSFGVPLQHELMVTFCWLAALLFLARSLIKIATLSQGGIRFLSTTHNLC